MTQRGLVRALVVGAAMLVAACGAPPAGPTLSIGTHPDDESQVIAHLYAAALRHYGTGTRIEEADDPLVALDAGDIAVVPGFTGRLLTRFEPDASARADEQVYREMVSALPEGLAAGDYTTSAEDKPAVAVTEATATAWGGEDLSTLVRRCAEVRAGAVRAGAVPTAVGTCRPAPPKRFPDASQLFAALRSGEINAAWTTTAAPGVPTELVILADPTALIRAENVVPIYRRNTLDEAQVLAVNEVAGVLDTAALAEMRARVRDGADPAVVADEWLIAHPLRD
ncbi:glycine betaine ABC transporter substrate-binding protein [Mycobacterium sp. WMMD1722]|uniref:glycine betaine ABC transporter substrate-binding protein n=1 Tax=Mycobacterium sp. WMMD1722 TaxID=3404117 RepID=UPI003BF5A9CA